MNYHTFLEFANSEEGKLRRKNFAQIDGVDTDDTVYFIECEPEQVKKARAEKDAHDYLVELEKESGIKVISLSEPQSIGDETVEIADLIPDPNQNIEEDYIQEEMKKKLKEIVSDLPDNERRIINALFLSENPKSERQYASETGIPRTTINYMRNNILEKIREKLWLFFVQNDFLFQV